MAAQGLSAALPFWGPPTSYLNFCEEDYVVTRFVAEFINTLSSLTYVAYGVYGLLQIRGQPRARSRSLLYCGLVGVGVCSAGYHMTLKYHTQMSDELSMHLLTTPLLHRLLTFNSDPRRARTTGLALLALLAAVMVTHMVLDEFLLHASAFGLAVYLIGNRVLRIIPQQVPDPGVRKKVRNVAIFGYLSFGFGYLVWLMDDWLCRHLTTFRHSVGVPFAFFTELHGWWHVFTAVGGYIAVSVVDTITSGEVRDDPVESLAWPVPMAARFVSGATAAKKDEKN